MDIVLKSQKDYDKIRSLFDKDITILVFSYDSFELVSYVKAYDVDILPKTRNCFVFSNDFCVSIYNNDRELCVLSKASDDTIKLFANMVYDNIVSYKNVIKPHKGNSAQPGVVHRTYEYSAPPIDKEPTTLATATNDGYKKEIDSKYYMPFKIDERKTTK